MSRIGSNPNKSSDLFEARMLPNVEDFKPEPGDDDDGEQGEYVDYQGDGRNTVYMAPWQKKVRNFGSRSTKVLAGRGTQILPERLQPSARPAAFQRNGSFAKAF